MKTRHYIVRTVMILFAILPVYGQWTQTPLPGGATVHVLAHTGTALFCGTGEGVYRSADDGMNWSELKNGITSSWVKDIEVFNDTIFVATSDGIYRSSDNGTTWQSLSTSLPARAMGYGYDLAVVNNKLFAAAGTELIVTATSHENWSSIDTSSLLKQDSDRSGPAEYFRLSTLFSSGDTLYGVDIMDGVCRSTDEGFTWTGITLPEKTSTIRGFHVNGSTMIITGNEVIRSADFGSTWTVLTSFPSDAGATIGVNGDTVLIGTTGEGLYISYDNGLTWINNDNEFTTGSLQFFNHNVFSGTDEGVFRSSDNGLHWENTSEGLSGLPLSAFFADNGSLYANTTGRFIRSTDNGKTWTNLYSGKGIWMCAAHGNILLVYEAKVSPSDFTKWMDLSVSYDTGITWTTFEQKDSSTSLWGHGNVDELVISNNVFFAKCSGEGLYKSVDSGKTWTPANSGIPVEHQTVQTNDVTVTTADPVLITDSIMFVSTIRGIYQSTNNGEQWTLFDSTLAIVPFSYSAEKSCVLSKINSQDSVCILSANEYRWNAVATDSVPVFIVDYSNETGLHFILMTTANGSNRVNITSDLEYDISYTSSVTIANNTIFINTSGHGIWQKPLPEILTQPIHSARPSPVTSSGFNNFRNATSYVTCALSLSRNQTVSVKVLDLSGRKAASLCDKMFEAGLYHFTWNKHLFAPGTYLFRLQAGPKTISERVTIVR